jgi:hypothetical protein
LQLEVEFGVSSERWDAFVQTARQRSVFSFSWYLQQLSCKFELVLGYLKGQPVVGFAVPLEENGSAKTSPISYCPYFGFLFPESLKARHSRYAQELNISSSFISILVERYGKLFLSNSWRLEDMRSFLWHNYNEKSQGVFDLRLQYTAILDLHDLSFEKYIENIRQVRRQEYTKFLKRDDIHIATSSDLNIFTLLHKKTFDGRALLHHSDEQCASRIAKTVIELEKGCFKVAYQRDVPIACTLFVNDDRTSFYLFGFNDQEFRKMGANTVLMLENIKNCLAHDIYEVDMVGVNSPNRGDFKLSFNATIKPYFSANFSH